jgi:hypothetical protein
LCSHRRSRGLAKPWCRLLESRDNELVVTFQAATFPSSSPEIRSRPSRSNASTVTLPAWPDT